MRFEWDDEKAAINERKHKVEFASAIRVFLDPHRLEDYDSDNSEGEDRWVAVGTVESRLLVVVYTERDDVVRIISARKATKHEQKLYHNIHARS